MKKTFFTFCVVLFHILFLGCENADSTYGPCERMSYQIIDSLTSKGDIFSFFAPKHRPTRSQIDAFLSEFDQRNWEGVSIYPINASYKKQIMGIDVSILEFNVASLTDTVYLGLIFDVENEPVLARINHEFLNNSGY